MDLNTELNNLSDYEIMKEYGKDTKITPRDIRKKFQDEETPYNYTTKPRDKKELKYVIADRLDTDGTSGRYS